MRGNDVAMRSGIIQNNPMLKANTRDGGARGRSKRVNDNDVICMCIIYIHAKRLIALLIFTDAHDGLDCATVVYADRGKEKKKKLCRLLGTVFVALYAACNSDATSQKVLLIYYIIVRA